MSTARLTRLADLGERELAGWRELARNAVEPNPFFDPDFVLPAARALGAWDDVAVVSVEDGSGWRACLPVRRNLRWHQLPLPCISTWLHPYCLLGTPLVAAGQPGDELRAILDALGGVRHTSYYALEWVPSDGPIGEALRAEIDSPIAVERFSRAALLRRPESDYLDEKISGKHRREIARLRRGFETELGGELTLVDRTHEPGAIDAFLELEASGWKGRAGTAIASKPADRAFFTEMVRALATRDGVELLFLEGGGATVAARCSLIAGGASFCFKLAYDERFKRFGPGRELELKLIEDFHSSGRLEWMDSCASRDNEVFNRLWPDRRELVTIANPLPGVLGSLAKPGLGGLIAARERRRRRHARIGGLSVV